jgi:hypothetical protein
MEFSGHVIRWKAKYFMADFAVSSETCQCAISEEVAIGYIYPSKYGSHPTVAHHIFYLQ